MNWFAVYCNIKCERRAMFALKHKGYEVYLPLETVWIRHARKKKKAERPLFPRYLFVGVDFPRQGFAAIRQADGVEMIVPGAGSEMEPMPILETFIDETRWAERAGVFDETQAVLRLNPGERVRLMKGPLAGFIGKLKSADRAKRVEVLVSILGAETVASIPLEDLRPA